MADKPDKLLHRDDLPMGVAEGIVGEMKGMFPDCEVVFAGDAPMGSESAKAAASMAEEFKKTRDRSIAEGKCFECGAQMPDWPASFLESEGGLPDGWGVIRSVADDTDFYFLCPACDDDDDVQEGV